MKNFYIKILICSFFIYLQQNLLLGSGLYQEVNTLLSGARQSSLYNFIEDNLEDLRQDEGLNGYSIDPSQGKRKAFFINMNLDESHINIFDNNFWSCKSRHITIDKIFSPLGRNGANSSFSFAHYTEEWVDQNETEKKIVHVFFFLF